ncbi:gliding motility protein GldL [Psychroserpens burtonensis]|uniref:Gliding motility protein GldL n=1 Tax=Psychroserpens burtonensis TaxID=49278 RepID=A0A5C7B7Q9_9FLAO|nr:gliding motility protein GldL [Psychroserpens burtonensis]
MNLKKLLPAGIILLLGIGATILGALFKIQHWTYGRMLLTIGTFLELLAIFMAIVALIKMRRRK